MRLPSRLLSVVLTMALVASAHAQSLVAEPAADARAGAPFAGGVEYLYDDGAANVNIGPPSSFDPDMLWGNYYLTQPGGEVITEIAVAFGATFPSRPDSVTFWLLNDPDADLDPRTGATAVASVTALPDVSGNAFFAVPIPPTRVSGAFFVGASAELLGGQDRPARVDTGARADRSWFFYAPDIDAIIDSLGTAPFGTRMDSTAVVPFPGAFMVRAHGEPFVVATEDASGDGTALLAPAPNPVADAATVRFTLPRAMVATVTVHDALGRTVATLAEGAQAGGAHAVRWETQGAAPGIYAVRLAAGRDARTIRLVVAR